MIYHYKDEISKRLSVLVAPSPAPAIFFFLIILNYMASRKLDLLMGPGFYINYALNAVLLSSLMDKKTLPFISRKLDKRCGEFSYPIYLIHFQAGLILLGSGAALEKGSLQFAIVSLPVILGLSWLMTAFVERPIEKVRQRVKGSARGRPK